MRCSKEKRRGPRGTRRYSFRTAHDDTDTPAIFYQSPEPGEDASTSANLVREGA